MIVYYLPSGSIWYGHYMENGYAFEQARSAWIVPGTLEQLVHEWRL